MTGTRTAALRAASLVPVLVLVSILTFLLVQLGPGDPTLELLGPYASGEDYARVRAEMGLDDPLAERYVNWASDALRGDLGRTLVPPIESVSDRLLRAFPVSLQLAGMALAMALGLAVPMALWSASHIGGRVDRWVSAASIGLISVPSFLMGLLLLLAFAILLPLFPVGQWARPTSAGWLANLHAAFLPALTLALAEAPVFTRLLRNDLASTLEEDFVLSARAKGLPRRHIMLREALRPSSFSLVTLAGVSAGRLIGGTVIVEVVFALPGVGSVVVDGALNNDYMLVQGAVLAIAVVYLVVNLGVDVLYTRLDPRVGHG